VVQGEIALEEQMNCSSCAMRVQLASIAWILASFSTVLNKFSSAPEFPLELKRWRIGGNGGEI
jgi:hypothetical protein